MTGSFSDCLVFIFTLDSICDDTNGTDTYLPHEKIDGCHTYVRCTNYIPTGQRCQTNLCFNYNQKLCDYCNNVICESEMTTSTQGTRNNQFSNFPQFFLVANILLHTYMGLFDKELPMLDI
jgi:hypothetical protein